MSEGALMGLVAAAVGVFSICGGALDWDFFMNSRKARMFVGMFGRNGARAFYVALGACFVVVGILLATGVLKNSNSRRVEAPATPSAAVRSAA